MTISGWETLRPVTIGNKWAMTITGPGTSSELPCVTAMPYWTYHVTHKNSPRAWKTARLVCWNWNSIKLQWVTALEVSYKQLSHKYFQIALKNRPNLIYSYPQPAHPMSPHPSYPTGLKLENYYFFTFSFSRPEVGKLFKIYFSLFLDLKSEIILYLLLLFHNLNLENYSRTDVAPQLPF